MNKELFYVQTLGYCGNACFWWKHNNKGYTVDIRQAKKFTKQEIINRNLLNNQEYTIWSCEYIDKLIESQKLIIDMQYLEHENSFSHRTSLQEAKEDFYDSIEKENNYENLR